MESVFIPAYWMQDIKLSNEAIKELSCFKQISLFSSVNFLNQIKEIQKQLPNVILEKPKRAKVCGQLLGCDSYCSDLGKSLESDAILYIGDGYFHPDALLFAQMYLTNKIPVFRWNPKEKKLEKILFNRIEKHVKKIKANLIRFTIAKTIGILVTTKHGQERLSDALKLKEKLESEGKTVFIFLDDTFNFSKIDDFNFIEVFVNSACPRIAQEDAINITKPIINIKEANDVNWYLERI